MELYGKAKIEVQRIQEFKGYPRKQFNVFYRGTEIPEFRVSLKQDCRREEKES